MIYGTERGIVLGVTYQGSIYGVATVRWDNGWIDSYSTRILTQERDR